MLLLYILCAVIAFGLYWWYKKPDKFPPGPKGLPLLGVLPYLSAFPEREFSAWSKKYGPILSVSMGWQDWIVLSDYDVIIETLVKHSDEFHERPYVRFFCMLTSNGVVFTPGGQKWRSHRRFGVGAIRSFGGSKGVMEKKINEEALHFTQQLQELEGKPFQIQDILTNAVSNVFCNIAFGRRYDYDDAKFQSLIESLVALFKIAGNWKTNAMMFVPFLCDIPPFSWHVQKSMESIQPIRDMITDLYEEHKSTYDPKDIRDIMDGYLQSFQCDENEFMLKDIQDFFIDMFVAGTDTAASTLRWGLLCIMLHVGVQERMQEEIDNIIGRYGTPSLSDREKMPYCCAVVHEVFRFKTLAALSLPRCVHKDVTVRGYFIPKGTRVMTNLWHVHNDDTYWTKPELFAPERHLNENGKFTNSRHVMPFGAGARVCMGEQLARAESWLFLITIIQRFRISVDPDDPDPPSLSRGSNGLVYIPDAYNMIIHSR
uniref:Cytochrome P450 2J6-like n=1 Tax=Phallusia mammillata TaxID=59560 RepID=A0A6F9DB76_9ASCI|nr:cytochrome P450 2J6-like [Phallusia mammillata]